MQNPHRFFRFENYIEIRLKRGNIMSQVTNSTLIQQASKPLCYYFNSTNKIQLIRLWNGRNYSLEKIVFPSQRILFEAKPESILEVHSRQEGEQLLESIFTCNKLKVKHSQPQLTII